MRVFIDGLSSLAHTITRKLVDAHDINPCDILVNTYDRTDTIDYRSWLDSRSIRWTIASYQDQSTINQIAQLIKSNISNTKKIYLILKKKKLIK